MPQPRRWLWRVAAGRGGPASGRTRKRDAYIAAVDGEPDRDPYGELDRAIRGVWKYGGRQRKRW
jgi:hypothetical protein